MHEEQAIHLAGYECTKRVRREPTPHQDVEDTDAIYGPCAAWFYPSMTIFQSHARLWTGTPLSLLCYHPLGIQLHR